MIQSLAQFIKYLILLSIFELSTLLNIKTATSKIDKNYVRQDEIVINYFTGAVNFSSNVKQLF